MAKADLGIASLYAALVPDAAMRDRVFTKIETEFHRHTLCGAYRDRSERAAGNEQNARAFDPAAQSVCRSDEPDPGRSAAAETRGRGYRRDQPRHCRNDQRHFRRVEKYRLIPESGIFGSPCFISDCAVESLPVSLQAAFCTEYTRRMNMQPTIEDISAIVSRFQAWAGAEAPARAQGGVRELTYNEAIRSRRNGSRVEEAAPESEKPVPLPSINAAAESAEKWSWPKTRISPHRRMRRDRPTSAEFQGVESQAEESSVVLSGLPAFQQVLAERVSILPVPLPLDAEVSEHGTKLALRISFAEHELLRRRAAEANLSLSGYLWSCVFEVEDLRDRTRHRMKAAETPRQLSYTGGLAERVVSLCRPPVWRQQGHVEVESLIYRWLASPERTRWL